MNNIKKIGILVLLTMVFMCCKQVGDSNQEKPKPSNIPKLKMEFTGFSIDGASQNPLTLLDGKKEITVHINAPTLNISLKEKYEDLATSIKIGNNWQALTFNTSATANFNFPTLKENVAVNVEIKITAKNREEIVLKFKVIYKPYEKLNITKISVADKDFVPPFDALKGKTIDIKRNTATITVETHSDTKELVGVVNEVSPLSVDPVRPYIARVILKDLNLGNNSISLKVKAKEKTEEIFNFIIRYTEPTDMPVVISSITIDDKVFSKGSSLESLNNSTVEITKKVFDLKVELSEDYAGKKVSVSNGVEAVSTKDSNWQGKVATLKCNEEYKDIAIKISASDKLALTYNVKVNRVKNVIEVFQIVLEEDKYGNLGKDLTKLLESSPTTETINVKKEKVNVKVILNSGESVEKAEIIQEGTDHISLNFSGTIANAELTLKEGVNNFILYLEKTVSSTKITLSYKFIFNYTKEVPKFDFIKLKLNDTDKWSEEPDLQNFVNSFVADGDALACKKEYSLWNTKATFICGIKRVQNNFEYAVSKINNLPTTWNAFPKNFEVILDDTTTYVFIKISRGDSQSVYRCELAPILNVKETALLKTEVNYLDVQGNELYAESGLTKKVKIILKPKSPKIAGIELKEPLTKLFTKVNTEGKYKNWYEVELPITDEIMEVRTINAKYEIQAENGTDKEEHTQKIKLIPILKNFEVAYSEDFANPVLATFDSTTKTYNFAINKDSVVEKKLYFKIFVAEYYLITSDGIIFNDGEKKTIEDSDYILKTFTIYDFENTKSFKLIVKDEDGNGSTEYNVEIK